MMKLVKPKLIWGWRESDHAWIVHEAGQLGFYVHGGVKSFFWKGVLPKVRRISILELDWRARGH